MDRTVPVILVNGILEAGKTHFLNQAIREETFIDSTAKGLILQCEQGEEEFDPVVMKENHLSLVVFEDESEFTEAKLEELVKKYDPDVVYVEHNAMWSNFNLPAWMKINQTLTVIDASTFRVYFNNMRQKFVDILTPSEVVIMYNCDDQKETSAFKRNITLINRDLQFLFFDSNENNVTLEDDLPYKIEDEILLQPDDYGIFYFEIDEFPARYNGKNVTFLGKISFDKRMPAGFFLAGRRCMTCCANDIQTLFTICDNRRCKIPITAGMWGEIHGTIRYQQDPQGRVLAYIDVLSVKKTSAPANEVIGLQG